MEGRPLSTELGKADARDFVVALVEVASREQEEAVAAVLMNLAETEERMAVEMPR